MFPIRNHTSLKPGTLRYDRLVTSITAKAESFLKLNPSRRESTFLVMQWRGNEYRAYAKFTSNQGTSSIAVTFESEFI